MFTSVSEPFVSSGVRVFITSQHTNLAIILTSEYFSVAPSCKFKTEDEECLKSYIKQKTLLKIRILTCSGASVVTASYVPKTSMLLLLLQERCKVVADFQKQKSMPIVLMCVILSRKWQVGKQTEFT
jgi:hypothetical protein